jgi:hypothetical protein
MSSSPGLRDETHNPCIMNTVMQNASVRHIYNSAQDAGIMLACGPVDELKAELGPLSCYLVGKLVSICKLFLLLFSLQLIYC